MLHLGLEDDKVIQKVESARRRMYRCIMASSRALEARYSWLGWENKVLGLKSSPVAIIQKNLYSCFYLFYITCTYRVSSYTYFSRCTINKDINVNIIRRIDLIVRKARRYFLHVSVISQTINRQYVIKTAHE